jgi:hypothetical protein
MTFRAELVGERAAQPATTNNDDAFGLRHRGETTCYSAVSIVLSTEC